MTLSPGSDSTGVRFGTVGEYTSPLLSTERARYEFLEAVRRRHPLPLWHLRSIFPLYSRWTAEILSEAVAAKAAQLTPEAARRQVEMVAVYQSMGMPEEAARRSAAGRPVLRDDPSDPIFHTFMILEFENPLLARLLMFWAQWHHLTHQREFEEALPPREPNAPETDGESDAFEFTKMTLHKDYWACQWAMETLWSWRFSSEGEQMMFADPPQWVPAFAIPVQESEEPPFCIRPGWDVQTETATIFSERLQLAVAAYVERKRQLAEAMGLVQTREKRQLVHFDWLALYQVCQLSYPQIAKWDQDESGADSKGEDTIRKGVQSAAELVKLSVRPGTRGRPRVRKE